MRFNYYNPLKKGINKNILIHAVSVGETEAVKPLVEKLLLENHDITISTVTITGKEMVRKTFGDKVSHIFFPLDFRKNCRCFLKKIRPYMIIMVETEIWPNFLNTCKELSIPVIIINGRISPDSCKNYKRFSRIINLKECLDIYDFILMQSQEDKERILEMGAKEKKTYVMGNLKFDSLVNNDFPKISQDIELDLNIPTDHKVIIAGSTHPEEEEFFFNAFLKLREDFPKMTAILAPRHIHRIESIIPVIESYGLSYVLKSNIKKDNTSKDVIIIDTIGELKFIYGLSDFAFIGGSIANIGGHNILESIRFGIPTFFGPNMFNFKFIREQALKYNCGFEINSPEELAERVGEFIINKDMYESIEKKAYQMIDNNSGAISIALRIVSHYL